MTPPSPRALEALDASLPALQRADSDYPNQGRPGESLDAYRQRVLPPRLYTLLAAVEGELLKKERVRGRQPASVAATRQPQNSPESIPVRQTETDWDRLRWQTERARAAR